MMMMNNSSRVTKGVENDDDEVGKGEREGRKGRGKYLDDRR